MLNAREEQAGKKALIFDIERPSSNFDFIDDYFCRLSTLRRILSQVRQNEGKSVLVEQLQSPSDILEENEDINKLAPDVELNSTTYRLSFFNAKIDCSTNINELTDHDFLGYAIIKKDLAAVCQSFNEGIKKIRVYESVIKPHKHDNDFIRNEPTWKCRVSQKEFNIQGYLYAQQNAITNSCAHVALRTVASQFLDDDLSYRQINEWVIEYRKNKGEPFEFGITADCFFPKHGLSNFEMCYVLEKIGAKTFLGSYKTTSSQPVPYQKILYGAVESGYPAILFFGFDQEDEQGNSNTNHHVIPITGHTFNDDAWVADANLLYFPFRKVKGFISSSNWASMFIGHDDNTGSNFSIPQNYLESQRICDESSDEEKRCNQQKSRVVYAIGSLPRSVELNPISAEALAADCILPILRSIPDNFQYWQGRWPKRLEDYHRLKLLVLRPILVTGSQYAQHLRKIRGWKGDSISCHEVIDAIAGIGDDYVWMVELSVPELFSANRRKIGEVVINPAHKYNNKRDFSYFYWARLPGCFAFLDIPPELDENGKIVRWPQFFYQETSVNDHVELIWCEEEAKL